MLYSTTPQCKLEKEMVNEISPTRRRRDVCDKQKWKEPRRLSPISLYSFASPLALPFFLNNQSIPLHLTHTEKTSRSKLRHHLTSHHLTSPISSAQDSNWPTILNRPSSHYAPSSPAVGQESGCRAAASQAHSPNHTPSHSPLHLVADAAVALDFPGAGTGRTQVCPVAR